MKNQNSEPSYILDHPPHQLIKGLLVFIIDPLIREFGQPIWRERPLDPLTQKFTTIQPSCMYHDQVHMHHIHFAAIKPST